MSASAQRRLWLALWAVALAAGCGKSSSEAPAPVPAPAVRKVQALSAVTCEGVEPTGMAPGWKLAPVQAAGPGNASASFPATVGERALLVVQETTGAPAQGFKAEAKLNGGDRVSVSSRNPLAAKVVELRATNGLDLSVDAGGARASVAALALPPPGGASP